MSKLGSAGAWGRRGLSLVLILIGAWAVSFVIFTGSLQRANKPTQGADGIVVLTGEGSRLTVAVALLRGGGGQRLLVSGVGQGIGEAALRKALGLSATRNAGEKDIFSCCIDMGHQAKNTEGNAAEAAAWAKSHGYGSLYIVTASYHMPRALLEIRRQAPRLKLVPHPVFPDNIIVNRWWAFPGTALTLATEYNKYLISRARVLLIGPAQFKGTA